jgi:ABC-2 type transport system ATP-binding protein
VAEYELTVRDVHKTFDPGLLRRKIHALRGVTFEVERGEVFGFLGPNGAGKTTTIKAITGIIAVDRGRIEIGGHAHAAPAAKRRLGFMSENPYFYNHLTGRELLRFYGELLGMDRDRIRRRSGEVLERVAMQDHADRPLRSLSKGMLQRTSLAQALLGSPQLLVLDEPMSGLDPLGRRDVRDIILAEKERGTTVFFSSHVIPDVETICDRVAILIAGRVRAAGSVHELVARRAEMYEATFVGTDPERLRTPLVSTHVAGDASWVRVESDHRDELIRELATIDARLVSLTPVRSSLEDFLLGQFAIEEEP